MSIVLQCRHPGIYKAHYLQDLVNRYGDPNEVMPAPELPDWCLEEEEGHSDNEEQNGGALEAVSRPKKRPKWDPRLKVCLMLIFYSWCWPLLLESNSGLLRV